MLGFLYSPKSAKKEILSCPAIEYECWRNPTKSEINFGEGAIHYAEFTEQEIGFNKSGKLKTWFVSPYDGLRYKRI